MWQDDSIHPAEHHVKFCKVPESFPKLRNGNVNGLQPVKAVTNNELDLPAQNRTHYRELRIPRKVNVPPDSYRHVRRCR